MLKAACLIARKDLRLVLSRGAGLVQALLLGLLLIFVFSLSRETGETMSGKYLSCRIHKPWPHQGHMDSPC